MRALLLLLCWASLCWAESTTPPDSSNVATAHLDFKIIIPPVVIVAADGTVTTNVKSASAQAAPLVGKLSVTKQDGVTTVSLP